MRNPELAAQLFEELRAGGFTVKWPKGLHVPGGGSGQVGPFVVMEGARVSNSIRNATPETIDAFADHYEATLAGHTAWLHGQRFAEQFIVAVSRIFTANPKGYESALDYAGGESVYDAGRDEAIPPGTPVEVVFDEGEGEP